MEREASSDQTLCGRMTDTTLSSIAILTDTIMLTSQSRSTRTSSEVPLEQRRQRKETISHLIHKVTLRQPMISQSNNVNKQQLHLKQPKLMPTQISIDDCLKHAANLQSKLQQLLLLYLKTFPHANTCLFILNIKHLIIIIINNTNNI